MNEPNGKAVKFRSLAEKRTSRAIKLIRQISNLSRRNVYDYSDAQVARVFDTLRSEIDAAQKKFAPPAVEDSEQGSLFVLGD